MTHQLAIYLLVFGGLLLLAVLLDDLAERIRMPGVLMVLLLGLLIDNKLGSGAGAAPLLSLHQAQQITEAALVLVLFFGGLTTNWSQVKGVIRPAARLATLGVVFTSVLLAVVMLLFGVGVSGASWTTGLPKALFVGAMVGSTDASAVFALLRPLRNRLPKSLLDLIEIESGFNDPMAVVLAGVALALVGGGGVTPGQLVIDVVRQFLLGIMVGFFGGSLTVQLLRSRTSLSHSTMLPVVSLALLLVLSGGTTLLGGSSLLAAYVAGLVMGNADSLDREVLEEAHASFAKMAELLLFLCMGLVVDPTHVVHAAGWGLLLFVVMQVVRLVIVQVLLLRTAFPPPQRMFVVCAGLRGAVPIALAIGAWASDVPWGWQMPPLALAVVLYGLLIQGFALVPLARRLQITLPDPGADPPLDTARSS